MESIWSRTVKMRERESGKLPERAEAVVIGAGMAGILTALLLKERGINVIVLEAEYTGSGQTKGTTAKITAQHGLCYDRLIRDFGIERARQYAEANMEAIDGYRRIIRQGQKPFQVKGCGFRECGAYLYSRRETEALERELEAAGKLGITAHLIKKTELPFPVKAALEFPGQACFHPLRFLDAAAEDIPVMEHTRVIEVNGSEVITGSGSVEAEHVVFATHYPFINFPGCYFMKQHQERSYVIAYRNAPFMEGMYYGIDPGGLSLRWAEGCLLVGGEGHRTGEGGRGGRFACLSEAANELFPGCREEARWAAQDCMPVDGVPYVGRYSKLKPNWYVETGFHKWGMTGAMAAAMTVSGLIAEGKSPYEKVFSPMRGVGKAGLPNLLTESGHAVKGLWKGIFGKARERLEEIPKGQGGIVELDGKVLGVYKGEDGASYILKLRCPHLGCRLEWNREEKTWDCPCHGSRFRGDGTLIDNPAQADMASGIHRQQEP